MTDRELVEVIAQIAADQPSRYGGKHWDGDEQEALFRDIRRLNLMPTAEHLWAAHYQSCERGGDFPPQINPFIADLRFQIRQRVQWDQIPSAQTVAGVLPTPSTEEAVAEMQKYLRKVGAKSLSEAVQIELEAKRRGVFQRTDINKPDQVLYDWGADYIASLEEAS